MSNVFEGWSISKDDVKALRAQLDAAHKRIQQLEAQLADVPELVAERDQLAAQVADADEAINRELVQQANVASGYVGFAGGVYPLIAYRHKYPKAVA